MANRWLYAKRHGFCGWATAEVLVHALAGKCVHGLSRHSRDEEKRDDCLESIQLALTNPATQTSHAHALAQWLRWARIVWAACPYQISRRCRAICYRFVLCSAALNTLALITSTNARIPAGWRTFRRRAGASATDEQHRT
jgi:hypothetical protein